MYSKWCFQVKTNCVSKNQYNFVIEKTLSVQLMFKKRPRSLCLVQRSTEICIYIFPDTDSMVYFPTFG